LTVPLELFFRALSLAGPARDIQELARIGLENEIYARESAQRKGKQR
jgi:hypothetical protein